MYKLDLEKIKRLRKRKNLTPRQMAKLMGLEASTYWRKENGERPFKDYEISKLCQILGTKPANLFKETKEVE